MSKGKTATALLFGLVFFILLSAIPAYAGQPPQPASDPSPTDNAVDVSTTETLSWITGASTTTVDVCFGESDPPDFIQNQPVGTPTYDPGTLDPDTTYYWRIDCHSSFGTTSGPLWKFTTGSGGGGLAAPGNFRVEGCSSTTITWAWDDANSSPNEDGSDIFDEGNSVVVMNIAADATFTVETGLEINATYTRYVKAFNSGPKTYSPASNTVEVCTLAAVPEMNNTTDTFTETLPNSIDVQVGPGGNPEETPIELFYAKGDAAGPTEAYISAGTQTSLYAWNIFGLELQTTYWFRARAQNWAGIWSGYCPVTAWSTSSTNPPEQASNPYPADFATEVADNVKLTWSAGIGADSHDVYFGASDPPEFVKNQTKTSYNPSNLDLDTTYYWRIDEVNVYGTTQGVVWQFRTVGAGSGDPPVNLRINQKKDPGSLALDNCWELEFSAVYVDGGTFANAAWIQLDNDMDFESPEYDSSLFSIPLTPAGSRCQQIQYDGPALSSGVTFYFRIRFKKETSEIGVWSQEISAFALAEYVQTLPRNDYHLVYLPANVDGMTPAEVFGDDIAGQIWVCAYDEANREWWWADYFEAGRGYFIWSYVPDTKIGVNGEKLDGSGDIVVPLTCTDEDNLSYYGWNLVRNPFSQDVSWSSCDLQNCETTYWGIWTGVEYEWFMDGGSHSPAGSDTIPGGASFWVHATGANAQITIPDPGTGGAPASLPPPALQWRLKIEARTGSCTDTSTYAAMREGAQVSYDSYDVIEIDSFAQDYIQAYFDHPEWGRHTAPYTQDTRPFPANGETVTWKLTVHATDAAGFVNLSWKVPEELRDGWRFFLRDESSGIVRDMSLYETHEYSAGGEDARTFTLAATCLRNLKLGDANLDGEVDEMDAEFCARAEHELETLSAEQRYVSDMNSDGKVDVFDALLILKRIRGHIPGKP